MYLFAMSVSMMDVEKQNKYQVTHPSSALVTLISVWL